MFIGVWGNHYAPLRSYNTDMPTPYYIVYMYMYIVNLGRCGIPNTNRRGQFVNSFLLTVSILAGG